MRYFTKEWYAKLQQFSTDGSSQKEARSVLDVYSKIFAKNFKNDPPFMPHIRTFHDCDLIEAFWRKDLSVAAGWSGSTGRTGGCVV